MKKYGLFYFVFLLSFIMYPAILYASPYVTARTWADVIILIFLVAVCYELVYLFYLRKKNNIKFGRALTIFFLFLLSSLEIYAVLYYADLAVNGYMPTDFLGNQTGETVYGLQAIKDDGWAHFIFVPLFIICTIYQIIYFVVVSRKGRK